MPLHLEPSPLAQDRIDPNIVYAGFSLRPYNEAWRAAQQAAEQRRSNEASKTNGIIAVIVASVFILTGRAFYYLRKKSISKFPRPLGGEGQGEGKPR